ncbi:MAG: type III-A CRISPR-associated RAMP protein Csm4 [Tissierellia bacterium]|nr:type III-A CRISPR-associated RAMP protein Csm4 [Tissierellia bacterium]
MKYAIYKLYFSTGVHIGVDSLTDGEYVINSDTIFSALCHEALKLGASQKLEKLVALAKDNLILLSDGLPFIKNELYLPKPLKPATIEEEGNSIQKKAFKKLKYIPVSKIHTYMKGKLNPEYEGEIFKALGKYTLRTQAWVRGTDEAKPYSVGLYKFSEGNGIYICIAYTRDEDLHFVDRLIHSLSYTGIGGKRSAGLGKFTYEVTEPPKELLKSLNEESAKTYMTLSICLPHEDEIEAALVGAYYLLNKRSGFVSSLTYSDTSLKKKDFYAFKSGSCFTKKFNGDIYDLSYKGNHPVYRYAKAMFMGVE